MKKILILIVLICGALMSLTFPPVDKTKVPIKNVQGLQDSLAAKVNIATLESATDEFYNKTQSNARFINEDGDTIAGTILVPTPAAGTNTTQVVNAEFVNKSTGIIQFQDNSTKTNTGDTNENTVGTYTIKGGSLGANGSIEILFFAMIGTSTQGSTFRVYFNGTLVGTAALSTNTHSPLGLYVWNKNSTTSQESAINSGIAGLLWAANSNALNTYSINTANDITVTFTIQAANSAYVGYLRRIKCTTYYSN